MGEIFGHLVEKFNYLSIVFGVVEGDFCHIKHKQLKLAEVNYRIQLLVHCFDFLMFKNAILIHSHYPMPECI